MHGPFPIRVPHFVVLLLAAVLLPTAVAEGLPKDPWLLPFDITLRYRPESEPLPITPPPTQRDIYEFAWLSFLALNWPYKEGGPRGKPDSSKPPAGIFNNARPEAPVVWETYMVPDDVFVDPKHWNVRWRKPDFGGLDGTMRRLKPPNYGERFAPGINQPYTHANVPTGPVVDQNREYLRVEVTLNQSYFTYIRQFSYYDADVQARAVKRFVRFADRKGRAPKPVDSTTAKARYFQPLPRGLEFYVDGLPKHAQQGMVEVKAAWKVLETKGANPDIPGRYFRRLLQFRLPDGSLSAPKLMGLVGFHIHRVTPSGHLPSTFEHVDNVRLKRTAWDPLPLPAKPALNPGTADRSPAQYPNGYQVGGVSGEAGLIPDPYLLGEPLIPQGQRKSVNVSRVTPIPEAVEAVNQKYQRLLKDSVWSYYQLIGTQNANIDTPNQYLGPGIPGPQHSNVQDLVNTTLETYTQKGFSCARCHLNAFPHGVGSFPPYEKRYEDLHVMSFLLLNAKSGRHGKSVER